MKTISTPLKLLINFAKVHLLLSRKFDRLSIHGLGFNDYIILYLLYTSKEKIRRIDLAEQTGLTPSGITRLLIPLEKTGLVARESNTRDARVSYVSLTATGRKVFEDACSTAENIAEDLLPDQQHTSELNTLATLLKHFGNKLI